MSGPFPRLTLVLGGVGSGKSLYAEGLIADARAALGVHAALYLATAESRDGEMAARIARHRARRGADWITVEEPLDLAGVLSRHMAPGRPVLIDCLTLWLGNLMEAERDVVAETARLIEVLSDPPAPVVVVSNEVGLGGISANALARRFADEAGRINQRMAGVAGRVVLVAAGLPLMLKDQPSA